MAFNIPSIADIAKRLKNSFRANLDGTDAFIEPNNLSITSKTFGLGLGEVYSRIKYLYDQLFASSADLDHLVSRHGPEYGVTLKASAAAVGKISVTQIIAQAQVLPQGIRFVRGDGITYLSTQSASDNGSGVILVPVAAEQAGLTTNCSAGTIVAIESSTFTSNLLVATVDVAGIGGGADVEDVEAFRGRILFRKQNPPAGGKATDYIAWATAVPGCTRAFVSGFNPRGGAVTVWPLFDITEAASGGIPSTTDLTAVLAYVLLQCPVTTRVYLRAAVPVPINITIAGMKNDTPTTRSAILAQLQALFAIKVQVATADNSFSLPTAWINEAIGRALGETRHTLQLPAADVGLTGGQIATLGTILYVPGPTG